MDQYKIVVTEKPSVAASISAVLGAKERKDGFFIGNGYIVSWCYGHLLELATPDAYGEQYKKWQYSDLPIVPDKWKHIPSVDKKEQLKILVELLNRNDIEYVVNACDAGREGELIFRLVYEHAKCTKPLKRLWISSLENTAIKEGFNNLRNGEEYDRLYDAASCRERADWLVGYNMTRLFSILYGTTLNTGRVQSPTLAMLTKREADINGFIKKPFFTVEIDAGTFSALSERYDTKEEVEQFLEHCDVAMVTDITETEKTISPPKLYDLTTLQREANRSFGFTAQQTLEYVQSLYEKKMVTYPRTDSKYITDDMSAGAAALVLAIAPDAPCDVSQVVNNKKVTDHHAIIPTIESLKAGYTTLPSGERNVVDMIKNRFVCAVGEKHRYMESIVTLASGGIDFKAKGKTILHNGWKDIDNTSTDDEDEETQPLSGLSKGQFINVTPTIKEGSTTPPKRYTEDTLLSSMETAGAEDMPEDSERKGLGTPATRASIIERLVKSGFVERQKKNLVPTNKGISLITILPNTLTSARLTAEWESQLKQIEHGGIDKDIFLYTIKAFVSSIVEHNNTPNPEYIALFPDTTITATETLGNCPRCSSPVREGVKGFFCDSRNCSFKIWRNSKFWTSKRKPLTTEIVMNLLKFGRIDLTGLYSDKSGKTYKATVILDDTGDNFVNFKMEF